MTRYNKKLKKNISYMGGHDSILYGNNYIQFKNIFFFNTILIFNLF